MSPEAFANTILSLDDIKESLALLQARIIEFNSEDQVLIATNVLNRVVKLMRGDTGKAIELSDLILQIAQMTDQKIIRAMGLRAKGQSLMVDKGGYQRAMPLFDEAIELHRVIGDEMGEALVQMVRIWAMANLGNCDRAIQDGLLAREVFRKAENWLSFARITNNLGLVYDRIGNYQEALPMFRNAVEGYKQLGIEGELNIPTTLANIAMTLGNLGQFQESVQKSDETIKLAEKYNQNTLVARARQNLGLTYSMMGNYTKAMILLDQAKNDHLSINQVHEAAHCDWASSVCLLELRRFHDVLTKCNEAYQVFSRLGMSLEAAKTLYNQARAYEELGRFEDAIQSLEEARPLFVDHHIYYRIALIDLEIASLNYQKGEIALSLDMALGCVERLESLNLPFWAAHACIIAGRAAFGLGESEKVLFLIEKALSFAETQNWPQLIYPCYALLGQLSKSAGEDQKAFQYFERAISEIERLRENLMIEFRVDYLEDKVNVYEQIVDVCISLQESAKALAFAEKAKSRSLQEMLTFRPDLSIRARHPGDLPIVEKIERLTSTRQQRMRFLDRQSQPDPQAQEGDVLEIRREIIRLEEEITSLWHQLLVRNAEYARDPSFSQMGLMHQIPDVADDEVLIEYFEIDHKLVVFLVKGGLSKDESIQVIRLPTEIQEIKGLVQKLSLNFAVLRRTLHTNFKNLLGNIQGIFFQLYEKLLSPFQKEIHPYKHLIFIPHGPLHYLPFSALYNGLTYLIESHEIRYLPASSFLSNLSDPQDAPENCLSIGHSSRGLVPLAVNEACKVAEILGGNLITEKDATLSAVHGKISDYRVLHLACHGEFHANNPLFSGLALEDGYLTTLDIFQLQLKARLVTLSACQTGKNVIRVGDELLGLMRGFITAGASSLVLTLWSVADESTAALMEIFYQNLAGGNSTGASIHNAQCALLAGSKELPDYYRHPFFWAPFSLVGADITI